MSKVFKVQGYWNNNGDPIDDYLITDICGTPDGYEDEYIFFYGIDESDIVGNHGYFTITSYIYRERGMNI